MELYNKIAYEISRHLTLRYSTSFGMSSRLFSRNIRPHIYAIYGLVRVADEIVDTYMGDDASVLLDELEHDTERSMAGGYSSNPIVQAFAICARKYSFGSELTRPFFASMRADLAPHTYDDTLYRQYIYGSAEVIGLMCLKVFVTGDMSRYQELSDGARALGAAYQKINFLRDMRDDNARLKRVYFPNIEFNSFNNKQEQLIESDIEKDFSTALEALKKLPKGARVASMLSYDYYQALFAKLKRADVSTIKTARIRISDTLKLILLIRRFVLR